MDITSCVTVVVTVRRFFLIASGIAPSPAIRLKWRGRWASEPFFQTSLQGRQYFEGDLEVLTETLCFSDQIPRTVMSREIKSFEFGPFHLEPRERLLLRNGEAIQLAPKVFETLVVLVEQSGHIVEKDELMKRLWPDTFVDESSLTRNISLLRKALGEDDTGHRYIETVPKLGYRFTADVNVSGDEQSDLVVEKRTFSQTISMEEEELIPSDAPQIRQNFEQKMLDSAESLCTGQKMIFENA